MCIRDRINKDDLEGGFDGFPLSGFERVVRVSAKENTGFELLDAAVAGLFAEGVEIGGEIVMNERQYQCLTKAEKALENGLKNRTMTPDVLLVDIEEALRELSLVTGKTINEEVIETIFSRFCVGK